MYSQYLRVYTASARVTSTFLVKPCHLYLRCNNSQRKLGNNYLIAQLAFSTSKLNQHTNLVTSSSRGIL